MHLGGIALDRQSGVLPLRKAARQAPGLDAMAAQLGDRLVGQHTKKQEEV